MCDKKTNATTDSQKKKCPNIEHMPNKYSIIFL